MLEIRQTLATLRAPVEGRDLDAIGADVRVLHVELPMTSADLAAIDRLLEGRSDLLVRIPSAGRDLSVLDALPALRRFEVFPGSESLDGLEAARGLVDLSVWQNERPFSLAPLAALGELRRLQLVGKHRDFEALHDLRKLEDLTVRQSGLLDLAVLLPLAKTLKALDIKLGSTADLSLLPEFKRLEYLELWRIRGLRDLLPIGGLRGLRFLFLQALGKIADLPDLSGCPRVWGVHLESMKAVTDLGPVLAAPALEMLLLLDMPQLRWDHVAPLRDHPRLRSALVGTGSAKRNEEIEQRLGLERAGYRRDELRWPSSSAYAG